MKTDTPTDAQIRGVMQQWWKNQFRNWGGDSLNECVNELVIEDDEDSEAVIYDRACGLLFGAKITIEWDPSDAEVQKPEWVDEEED